MCISILRWCGSTLLAQLVLAVVVLTMLFAIAWRMAKTCEM